MDLQRRRILVVDDDRGIREHVKRLLYAKGFEVVVAGDGKQALAALQGGDDTGAVVLDLLMPAMTGWEFLDAKAADHRIRDVPVFVMTAHDHPQARLRNVAGLYRKPHDLGRMVDALATRLYGASPGAAPAAVERPR